MLSPYTVIFPFSVYFSMWLTGLAAACGDIDARGAPTGDLHSIAWPTERCCSLASYTAPQQFNPLPFGTFVKGQECPLDPIGAPKLRGFDMICQSICCFLSSRHIPNPCRCRFAQLGQADCLEGLHLHEASGPWPHPNLQLYGQPVQFGFSRKTA